MSYDLLVTPQNRWEDEDSAGHMSRSSGLFCVEGIQARVSHFGVKTGGGAARIVHVTSLWRLRRDQVEGE
jgi:hypothetical protein